MSGVVALVGRPNVGKSTLFNRIVGGRRAIVDGRPGVTRDRLEEKATWRGRPFTLLDTGGIGLGLEAGGRDLGDAVALQASVAIEAADSIVLVTDARAGLQPLDEEIAAILRRRGRPFVVAANKCDDPAVAAAAAADLARLGAPVHPISAEHGLGVDDLLEAVLPVETDRPEAPAPAVRIAIVGRPNVGKSTLLNRILGEDRAVVADAPGTTRDPVRGLCPGAGGALLLVDTAGLRRRSRVGRGAMRAWGRVERAAVARAVAEISAADVALLLLDPAEGPTIEDRRIAALVGRRGAGLVVVIHKWDLVTGEEGTFEAMEASVRRAGGLLAHAPVVAASARTGRGLDRLIETAVAVAERRAARVPTAVLNRLLAEPPLEGPRGVRVKYATQVASRPPAFALFSGSAGLPAPFLRAVEGRLREGLDLAGVPIRLVPRRPEARPRRPCPSRARLARRSRPRAA